VRQVHAGERRILPDLRPGSPSGHTPGAHETEIQVIELISQGMRNKEMPRRWGSATRQFTCGHQPAQQAEGERSQRAISVAVRRRIIHIR
jgi:hypothetical protein